MWCLKCDDVRCGGVRCVGARGGVCACGLLFLFVRIRKCGRMKFQVVLVIHAIILILLYFWLIEKINFEKQTAAIFSCTFLDTNIWSIFLEQSPFHKMVCQSPEVHSDGYI